MRRSCAVAAALAAFASPAVAHAEPITVLASYPQRASVDGTPSTRQSRADDDYAWNVGINRDDCESDEQWSWSFGLPAAASFSTLEVWASADPLSCADPSARAGSGPTPRCWKAASFAFAAVANGGVVKLASRDVIKAVFRMKNVDDASLTAKADICEPAFDMQPTRVYLHFLPMDASGQALGGATSNPYESVYQTTYDLRGPDAPDAPTANAGPLIVAVDWPAPSAIDKDAAGYAIYCTPVGAAATPPADAGAVGCWSQPGHPSPNLPTQSDETHRCATSITNAATIYGLQPGTSYAIRVAALDRYGNTGPISKGTCGVSISGPRDYQPDATSSSGCSLGTSSPRSGSWMAALLAMGALGLVARARRGAPARSPRTRQ
jgi:hypothetical protein